MTIGLCAALAPGARAAGTLTEISGAVRVSSAGKAPVAAVRGRAIEPGTTIATGKGARAVVRFDDGSRVELDENTELDLKNYRFAPDAVGPYANYERLRFTKGSMRVVTGMIAASGPGDFILQTPVTDIVTEQADFAVASGSLYLEVLWGKLVALSNGNPATFVAGQIGYSDGAAAPVAIGADQLPVKVAASFSRFGPLAAVSGGAASGASGATGTLSSDTALTRGFVATGVAIVAASIGRQSSSTTHH